jgi:pimeloyl-ACP methyl ester carboxylesterase
LNEKAFIAVVEQAQADEFADIMTRPGAAEEQALRAHLGDDRYQRLHAMALRRNVIRSTRKAKGNVVVLPGIMGSELSVVSPTGTRTQVWVHALRVMDGQLSRLRLAEDRGRQAADENVYATGIMKRHYGELLLSLAQNWTVRAFWYDWRRSLEYAAIRLQALLRDWFDEDEPVHFVGHGMGGLVARAFVRNDPIRWESCLDTKSNGVGGGRLVLMGTPHHGSFAVPQAIVGIDPVIKKLAQLDLRHDLGEVRNVFNSFVGPYQMLPSHVHDPSMKPLYRSEVYAPIPVTQRHLDVAYRHYEVLGDPPDDGRLINLLGYGQPTVSGIGDLGRLRHPDAYEVTLDGDGRVPLRLGRLSTSTGGPVPTWYVEARHGDLTANADFRAALWTLILV